MENEIWKDIPDYEGIYQVSNLARIKSLSRLVKNGKKKTKLTKDLILKQTNNTSGYKHVTLCKNTINKNGIVHILVAKAFIPNPDNKPEVNHKDGVKTNNNIENLEWVTSSENRIHAYETGLSKRGSDSFLAKKVLDTKTGIIYGTVKEASISVNIKYSTLNSKLNGTYKNDTDLKYTS